MRNRFCEICNKQLNNFYSNRCLIHRIRPSGMKYKKNKDNPTSFQKGAIPFNKGMKGYMAGEKHYRFGKNISQDMKKKISAGKQGISIKEWSGFKNTENRRERVKFQQIIQKEVLVRDNYTCQICLKHGGILHVDHIQPFSEYVGGRFKMENCRTLCRECHYEITFGRPMPKNNKWGKKFMPFNSNINFEEKAR